MLAMDGSTLDDVAWQIVSCLRALGLGLRPQGLRFRVQGLGRV